VPAPAHWRQDYEANPESFPDGEPQERRLCLPSVTAVPLTVAVWVALVWTCPGEVAMTDGAEALVIGVFLVVGGVGLVRACLTESPRTKTMMASLFGIGLFGTVSVVTEDRGLLLAALGAGGIVVAAFFSDEEDYVDLD
jgi:hypothetical protein